MNESIPNRPERAARGDRGLPMDGRRRVLRGLAGGLPATLAMPPLLAPAGAQVPAAAPVPGSGGSPAAGVPAAGSTAAGSSGPRPRVVVLNSRDASVSLIDQASFAEVGRIGVGKEPHHLYPTPDGRQLIVASAVSNELHFLDPVSGELRSRLRDIDDPYQLAFSPDQRWFATAALRLDRVDLYAYDGTAKRLAARIAAPKLPSHLWFSSDSRIVFVTLQGSDEVAAIDVPAQKLLWKMPVGKQPAGIVLSPDERLLFVGIMGEDYVEVIDWRNQKTVERLRTGVGAHNFRGHGDRRRLLVSNRVADTVSSIDMVDLKVLDTIKVPGGPDCMELADDGRTLWVTSRWTKRVTVVDLAERRVARSVPVGRSPHGIYLHNRVATI